MAPKSVTFRRHDTPGVCAFWRFAQPFLQHYIFNVFVSCLNTRFLLIIVGLLNLVSSTYKFLLPVVCLVCVYLCLYTRTNYLGGCN